MNTPTTSSGNAFPHRPEPLPVDVEHHVLARRQRCLDRRARRAVGVRAAQHRGPLQQIAIPFRRRERVLQMKW